MQALIQFRRHILTSPIVSGLRATQRRAQVSFQTEFSSRPTVAFINSDSPLPPAISVSFTPHIR